MTMPDKIHYLCNCPDYLHGTGKQTKKKKKATCKHCKGARLPFTPIGGTVRIHSTPYVTLRNYFGTVRLPPRSTSYEHQSSTILCREIDPYNLLRQSRLKVKVLMQLKKFKSFNLSFFNISYILNIRSPQII